MNVAHPAKIVDQRRITGLGIGAAAIFALAVVTMLGLGLWVGFDLTGWSISTPGQRMAAGVSLGLACGSLFALVADTLRQAIRR